MDYLAAFFKQHNFNGDGIMALLLGSAIMIGRTANVTWRQAAMILACGAATNAYIVPLAFWSFNLSPDTPLARSAAFFAGLYGMHVITAFIRSGEQAKTPRDFLKIFIPGTGTKDDSR